MSGRFSAQEWSVIARAPLLAAMSVIADDRGGMRSNLAAVRGDRDARGLYDTELMRELIAMPPADAIERPRDREALRHEAPAGLRPAMDVLERVASAEERAQYRRFVLALAEAAGHIARKDGLLRRGRATPTDSERDALRSIIAIFDGRRSPCRQSPHVSMPRMVSCPRPRTIRCRPSPRTPTRSPALASRSADSSPDTRRY